MASRILVLNGANGGVRNTIALIVAKDGPTMASVEMAALRTKSMKNLNIRGYCASTKIQYPSKMKMSNNFVDVKPTNVIVSRNYGDAPPLLYTSVPEVFERINAIASADMVKKVNAIYVFEVEGGKGKYYIQFKEGDGQAGEGDVPNKAEGFKPDVKITMNIENMLKMFNRELKPATAFMTGKLKLSGELSKALALETVLKEAREAAEAAPK
jgi:putative sterol carrier protein